MKHLPLVKAIAVHIGRRLPEHVDFDDLIQAGTVGLVDAVNKFDSEKQGSFGAYAKHRIRGAILDSLRQADWASRETRRNHRRVETALQELSAELQRTPAEAEIAARLEMSVDELRRMMIDLRIELVSAETHFQDEEGSVTMEFPDKEENQPEILFARRQLREALGSAIKTLSAREQNLLTMYYTDEISMSKISRILGVHESRTSQIHKRAVQKIARVFESAGIQSCNAC